MEFSIIEKNRAIVPPIVAATDSVTTARPDEAPAPEASLSPLED